MGALSCFITELAGEKRADSAQKNPIATRGRTNGSLTNVESRKIPLFGGFSVGLPIENNEKVLSVQAQFRKKWLAKRYPKNSVSEAPAKRIKARGTN
jgi:hypothetical protein